jgi:1-acyl-sn-glycerol-3-phosphate acyltransferase
MQSNHFVSGLALLFITLNLLFWLVPLTLLSVLRLVVPGSVLKMLAYRGMCRIYAAAVEVDNFLLQRILHIEIEIIEQTSQAPSQQQLVICNHRSWFDILILQRIFVPRGEILKFLIKKELVYVPIVGWICLALGFPRLIRASDARSREQDLEQIRKGMLRLNDEPAVILLFAEGSRFSHAKKLQSESPYNNLLKPRPAGLETMIKCLPKDTTVVDVTLVYPDQPPNFWSCLSGNLSTVLVDIKSFQIGELVDIAGWLNGRWLEKDRLISDLMNSNQQAPRGAQLGG